MVVAVLLRRPVKYATVEADGSALGRVALHSDDPHHGEAIELDLRDEDAVSDVATILVAGFAGEALFTGEIPDGCGEDLTRCWRLLEAANGTRTEFDATLTRALVILRSAYGCVEAVATELRRRGRIEGDALRRLVRYYACQDPDLRRAWRRR